LSVDLNLASVGLEVLRRAIGGDAALNGETAGRDAVLCEPQLPKRGSSSNPGSRVDFDEGMGYNLS